MRLVHRQRYSFSTNFAARLTENEYLWRWTTRIEPPSGSSTSPVDFDQSQFAGALLSAAQLRKIAADYIPELSDEGILRRRTFELMDRSEERRVGKESRSRSAQTE